MKGALNTMKYLVYYQNKSYEMKEIKTSKSLYEKLGISTSPNKVDFSKMIKDKVFGEPIILIKK